MDVIANAVNVLFSDPSLGRDGTFTPTGGSAQAVRVLGLRPVDPTLGLPSPDVAAPGFTAELLRSAVPTLPLEQSIVGTLVVDDTTYRVHTARQRHQTWVLDLFAA